MKRFGWALLAMLLCLCLGHAAMADFGDAAPLVLNESTEAIIENGGDYVYFSFEPAESGMYYFCSNSEEDTYGYLYDAEGNELIHDDDSGNGTNFRIQWQLSAGNVYYFGVRYYSHAATGTFDVMLELYHGLTQANAVESNVAVPYNTEATLEVIAQTTDGDISYQWYQQLDDEDNVIPGATGSSFTVEHVTGNMFYYCTVTDAYDHTASISFEVRIDNQLKVRAVGDTDRRLLVNETTVLQVEASCAEGSLTYVWRVQSYDQSLGWSEEEIIDGAVTGTITTAPLTVNGMVYRCIITDQYGESRQVSFYINLDNRLTVEAVGDTEIYVEPGAVISLQVEASCANGSLTYAWYKEEFTADGWGSNDQIEGAATNAITTEAINTFTTYSCRVTDQYGTRDYVYFTVRIDNGLEVLTRHREYRIQPGGSVTLEVQAVCTSGALRYNWGIDGYNEPSLTVTSADERTWYSCSVSDIYGNSVYCHFEVQVETNLSISPVGDPSVVVPYGGSVTLQVSGHCDLGNVEYDWAVDGYDSYGQKSFSADRTSCTLTNVTGYVEVYAEIYDEYSNYATTVFKISVDNQFSVSPVGDTMRTVQSGDSVTLAVQAQASEPGFRYMWKEEDHYLDEEGVSITFTAEESTVYYCYVYDKYNTPEIVSFTINVGTMQTISAGQTVNVSIGAPKQSRIYMFTPSVTGMYTIYSYGSPEADPYIKLFDDSGTMMAEVDDVYSYSFDNNDAHCRLTASLTAGKTYYYWIYAYKIGSFYVKLIRDSSGTGNGTEKAITLRTGQTIILPQLFGTINSLTSDTPAVVSVSDTALTVTAAQAGTAVVTAICAQGTVTYDVTVVSGPVLSMPADLQVIEQNAFAGDRNAVFAVLGSRVTRIEAFAFLNSGLKQIVIPSMNTEIAFSAFSGLKPLIVCRPGSKAEYFAKEFGYTYVYIN